MVISPISHFTYIHLTPLAAQMDMAHMSPSLSQWYIGVNKLCSGTQVISNFFNGIQVKLSSTVLCPVAWVFLEAMPPTCDLRGC
jgi:hypothetical protein